MSLLGPICLLLAYSRCRCGGTSQKPGDQILGLTEQALPPAAAQVVAQAGVLARFAEASERTLKNDVRSDGP